MASRQEFERRLSWPVSWIYLRARCCATVMSSRQCNNDLRDVGWRTPLNCQDTLVSTPLQSCLTTLLLPWNDRVINEKWIGGNIARRGRDLFCVQPNIYLEGLRKITKESIRIVGVCVCVCVWARRNLNARLLTYEAGVQIAIGHDSRSIDLKRVSEVNQELCQSQYPGPLTPHHHLELKTRVLSKMLVLCGCDMQSVSTGAGKLTRVSKWSIEANI
jgi:hypothetical protein